MVGTSYCGGWAGHKTVTLQTFLTPNFVQVRINIFCKIAQPVSRV